MADGDVIAYSIASFICALYVLERGADKFVDHTAIVARRTGVPQAVIGLLTAGAEWEEVSDHRAGPSLQTCSRIISEARRCHRLHRSAPLIARCGEYCWLCYFQYLGRFCARSAIS